MSERVNFYVPSFLPLRNFRVAFTEMQPQLCLLSLCVVARGGGGLQRYALSPRLRGGSDEVISHSSRDDDLGMIDGAEGEVYVTLQFDPLRALYDATRRVRWALGVAWRTLSRAVSSTTPKARRRSKSSRGDYTSREEDVIMSGTVAAAAKVSRRRGLPVLVRAAKSHRAWRAMSSALKGSKRRITSVVHFRADFEAASKLVYEEMGQRPRGESFLALAVPENSDELRVLAVRQQAMDMVAVERWLARCQTSHASDFADLKRIADDAALVRSQAEEIAQAVESDEDAARSAELREKERLRREQLEKLAAEEAERVAARRAEKKARLPPEPVDESSCVVAVRDPDGAKHARRFASDAQTSILLDWIDVLEIDLDSYNLRRPGSSKFVHFDDPKAHIKEHLGRRVLLECVPKKKKTQATPDDH